jgi:hypothetical protein
MQPKIPEQSATHPVITRISNQFETGENDKMAKDMLSVSLL